MGSWEQNDDSVWPVIAGSVENCDFSGKTVIPFCALCSDSHNDSGIKDLNMRINKVRKLSYNHFRRQLNFYFDPY